MNRALGIGFGILLCAVASTLSAQTAVYALGGGTRVSGANVGANTPAGENGNFTAYGGTAGIYSTFAHAGPLNLGMDFRFSFDSSSNNNAYGNSVRDGFFGLRAAVKLPTVPVKPYVQAEFGAATTNYGIYPSSSGSGAAAYELQGGADVSVLPHMDIRGEYGVGQALGSSSREGTTNLTLQQFGVGLVFRF